MTNAPVIRIRAKVPSWAPYERLRKIRRDENLTQADMADKLAVKASTYAAWEAGRNKIPDIIALSDTIEQEFGYSKHWFRGDLDGDGWDGPDSANSDYGAVVSGPWRIIPENSSKAA